MVLQDPIADKYIEMIEKGDIYPEFLRTVTDSYGREKTIETLKKGIPIAIEELENILKENKNFSEREMYEQYLKEYRKLLEEINSEKSEITYRGIKI